MRSAVLVEIARDVHEAGACVAVLDRDEAALASYEASSITRVVLPVDGGIAM